MCGGLPGIHLPATLLVCPEEQTHLKAGIAGAGFTACRRHHDQAAIGSQLQHSLSIFSAELGELLWGEAQVGRNP